MVVTHGIPRSHRARCALTIGNFDGVHRGHQAMLGRVIAQARAEHLQAAVLTFEPHPREFFSAASAPARVSRLREKLEHFADHGIDRVHVARFDARLAGMAAADFIEAFLVEGLRAAWLLVGRDFRFGARRAGDWTMLAQAGARAGFRVEAMPDVLVDGMRASSSRVRDALLQGDFAAAERLLGRPYAISGRVVHGAKLGRTLGYPTANIRLPYRAPLQGIFVVEARGADRGARDRWLPGVASLGLRPTVNALKAPLLEVHLFGFDRVLYGEHLRVRFRAKLREEQAFPDLHSLRDAIARDVAQAKEHFVHHG